MAMEDRLGQHVSAFSLPRKLEVDFEAPKLDRLKLGMPLQKKRFTDPMPISYRLRHQFDDAPEKRKKRRKRREEQTGAEKRTDGSNLVADGLDEGNAPPSKKHKAASQPGRRACASANENHKAADTTPRVRSPTITSKSARNLKKLEDDYAPSSISLLQVTTMNFFTRNTAVCTDYNEATRFFLEVMNLTRGDPANKTLKEDGNNKKEYECKGKHCKGFCILKRKSPDNHDNRIEWMVTASAPCNCGSQLDVSWKHLVPPGGYSDLDQAVFNLKRQLLQNNNTIVDWRINRQPDSPFKFELSEKHVISEASDRDGIPVYFKLRDGYWGVAFVFTKQKGRQGGQQHRYFPEPITRGLIKKRLFRPTEAHHHWELTKKRSEANLPPASAAVAKPAAVDQEYDPPAPTRQTSRSAPETPSVAATSNLELGDNSIDGTVEQSRVLVEEDSVSNQDPTDVALQENPKESKEAMGNTVVEEAAINNAPEELHESSPESGQNLHQDSDTLEDGFPTLEDEVNEEHPNTVTQHGPKLNKKSNQRNHEEADTRQQHTTINEAEEVYVARTSQGNAAQNDPMPSSGLKGPCSRCNIPLEEIRKRNFFAVGTEVGPDFNDVTRFFQEVLKWTSGEPKLKKMRHGSSNQRKKYFCGGCTGYCLLEQRHKKKKKFEEKRTEESACKWVVIESTGCGCWSQLKEANGEWKDLTDSGEPITYDHAADAILNLKRQLLQKDGTIVDFKPQRPPKGVKVTVPKGNNFAGSVHHPGKMFFKLHSGKWGVALVFKKKTEPKFYAETITKDLIEKRCK